MTATLNSRANLETTTNFPVSVTLLKTGGWGISITKKGIKQMLMQAGWKSSSEDEETGGQNQKATKPYQFKTEHDAWQFMLRIHRFCSKSNQVRHFDGHHIANCEGCGQVFKSSMSPFCDPCLTEKPDIFKQFCEGVYHRTGSPQEALSRLACMIKSKKTVKEKIKQKEQHQRALRQAVDGNRYGTTQTLRVPSCYQSQ